jgi:hypothetical protein
MDISSILRKSQTQAEHVAVALKSGQATHVIIKEVMRLGRTTRLETLGNAAVFFFMWQFQPNLHILLPYHFQRNTKIELTLPIEQSGSYHTAI